MVEQTNQTTKIHGTAIGTPEGALLLTGPSGAGKSDLAFRLISNSISDGGRPKAHQFQLISDDQTCLKRRSKQLLAYSPNQLKGLIELRHIGIKQFPYLEMIPLRLIINLDEEQERDRLPSPAAMEILGLQIPLYCLGAFHPSTEPKIRFLFTEIMETSQALQ